MKYRIKGLEKQPPPILYHGTSRKAAAIILEEGIKPMQRQRVHLSTSPSTALSIGARHDKKAVLISVDAENASTNGIPFYVGNDTTWLADFIPPQYVSREDPGAENHPR